MELTPEQWERVKAVFETVLDKPPAERSAHLATANEDPSVLEEVGRLLRSHSEAGNFLSVSPLASPVVPELTMEVHSFNPGDLLADRFRITSFLARGGMGEVYEAEDVELREQVALKTIRSELLQDTHALERFKREVHLAKQVTHPNVCRIFDLFRHATSANTSILLVSMELLRGETLAAHLERVGRMTWRAASPIAFQLANGLGAAHEMGILHRDFKPSNVVLIQGAKGIRAVITDFGLALQPGDDSKRTTMRTGTGHFGTPAYMSPEQVEGGGTLTPASDVYSLGLVLYEMVTGTRPFDDPTPLSMAVRRLRETPTSPRTLVPELDATADRVISHCIERIPTHRFATADEVAKAIKNESWRPVPSTHGWPALTWLACVLGLILCGLGVLYYRSHHAKPLTQKDTVLLADFSNATGDPVFDDALKRALSVELEQSPFLNILSDQKVSETLRMMGRPASQPLTGDISRELCLRTGSKAWVGGKISSLGSHYLIDLNAVACGSGDTLAGEQVEATRKEDVLKALSRASSALRSKLGESLPSVKKFSVPFPATTSSLEALKSYTLGAAEGFKKGDTAGIPFMKHAIELDPNFAMAYTSLATFYGNLREPTLALEYATKAYQLRDRTTERERLRISADYYAATGELEKEEETYQVWIANYPGDQDSYGNLGVDYLLAGNYDKALPLFQQALQLSPNNLLNHANLGVTYLFLNRLDDAKAAFDLALARKLDGVILRLNIYIRAFLVGDTAEMERQVAWGTGKHGEEDALLSAQSDTEAYYGRMERARDFSRRAMDSAVRADSKEVAALWQVNAALREAELGNLTRARQGAKAALALSSGRNVTVVAALALARSGDIARAKALAGELRKNYPTNTLVQLYWLPTIDAAVQLETGNSSPAILDLEPASTYELGQADMFINYLYPVYVRGQAYLGAHKASSAAAEFQKLLDHRPLVLNFVTAALVHLEIGRAYAMAGDTAKANAAYQDFFQLWKDADPDIPILQQAKTEYVRLK
jgi:eukaryotic-like serine/threonine-protein kinase